MTTLGITGGIGSGKTTVCQILEELGARVFYADLEAKQFMADDVDVRREIVEAFGPKSYDAAGELNRAYLAEQVFGDDEKVARINRIVHPRVHAQFERKRTQAKNEGVGLLVYEAALIYESGGDQHLDTVAVVDAPRDERIDRVTERDQVSPMQVEARMGHQFPPEELRRRADHVIDNSGSQENLRRQVEELYRALSD